MVGEIINIKEELNQSFIRVNKSQARKLFNDGVRILVYPINININSMWSSPSYFNRICPYTDTINDFDKLTNEFEYYNCNIHEVGYYAKYYVNLNIMENNKLKRGMIKNEKVN